MDDQGTTSGLGSGAGRPFGNLRSWRDTYPVLLGCLSEGRSPSAREIELVVGRMNREIGTGADSVWSRTGPAGVRRRMLVAVARAALLGRQGPRPAHPQFPLVLRGH